MDNETQGQATPPAAGEPKKKTGIFGKIAGLWKSGVKGKVICIVGVLMILGIIGAFTDDEEGGGDGGGGNDWKISGKFFYSVFNGFPKDEGMVYKNASSSLKVMQATKKGNLVTIEDSDRVIWVETKRRYEDDEPLDKGYYIRSGSMEYETALGAEKRVARYVEVTDKVQKKIDANQAAIAKQVEALGAGKAPGERKTITLPGGVAMELAWCPPGTFRMGDDEIQVTLTKGFWMGKTEVTQAQWKSVMWNNPSKFEGDDLPVVDMSWDECQQFCQNTGLQLPTEAQWEYACRAGSTGPYAGTGKLDEMGWYGGDLFSDSDGTHPVGTKQSNAWGLYDMHGNVWELCADWYDRHWYDNYRSAVMTDPVGPSSGYYRVRRGGSWHNRADDCTSSARDDSDRSAGYDDIGFRVVRTLSE